MVLLKYYQMVQYHLLARRFKPQGTVSLNGSDVNVKDLQNNDTPTFSNVNLSNVSLLGTGETN